ncbi:MAG: hypothetical protein K2X66_05365 [Cyanobacteria bacterium]|nr:hypothetical protein [Cyanobacteriota bacterium]
MATLTKVVGFTTVSFGKKPQNNPSPANPTLKQTLSQEPLAKPQPYYQPITFGARTPKANYVHNINTAYTEGDLTKLLKFYSDLSTERETDATQKELSFDSHTREELRERLKVLIEAVASDNPEKLIKVLDTRASLANYAVRSYDEDLRAENASDDRPRPGVPKLLNQEERGRLWNRITSADSTWKTGLYDKLITHLDAIPESGRLNELLTSMGQTHFSLEEEDDLRLVDKVMDLKLAEAAAHSKDDKRPGTELLNPAKGTH